MPWIVQSKSIGKLANCILSLVKRHYKNLDFLGKPLTGRYVIVQMDNGDDVPLNLKEVRVYGNAGRKHILN